MIYNCSPAVFLHWDCSPEKLWLCRRFSEKEKADWKRSLSCPRNPWIFSTASSLGHFHLAVVFRCSTEHQQPLEKGWWLRCPAAIFGFSSLRPAFLLLSFRRGIWFLPSAQLFWGCLEGFLLWSSWLAWPTGIVWILHQLFSLGMTFGEGWLSLQSGLFSPSPQDAIGTNLASSHCHILTSKAVWI